MWAARRCGSGRWTGPRCAVWPSGCCPGYEPVAIDRVTRRVATDSAGMPLLAVELLRAVALGLDLGTISEAWPEPLRTLDQTLPGELPDAVVAAIRIGFRRLSPSAQRVLAAAAVLGDLVPAAGAGARGRPGRRRRRRRARRAGVAPLAGGGAAGLLVRCPESCGGWWSATWSRPASGSGVLDAVRRGREGPEKHSAPSVDATGPGVDRDGDYCCGRRRDGDDQVVEVRLRRRGIFAVVELQRPLRIRARPLAAPARLPA